MGSFVFAVSPILAGAGQIAAIVICLFILIFVLLAVAFNLLMTFAISWVYEKVGLLKMLRPTVESINKASESVTQGVAPTANENMIVRTAASLPANVRTIKKKVERATDRVASAVIEFRARTLQVQTVVKVLLLPGLMRRKPATLTDEEALEMKSFSSGIALEEQPSQRMEERVAGASNTLNLSANRQRDVPVH